MPNMPSVGAEHGSYHRDGAINRQRVARDTESERLSIFLSRSVLRVGRRKACKLLTRSRITSDLRRAFQEVKRAESARDLVVEELRVGLESGWDRRHAGEGSGPGPAANTERPHLAVHRRPGSSGRGLRLHSTRGCAGPEKFLEKYRGHLQADVYVVYDSFFTDPERGMVEVACWAHTRRHFHKALERDRTRMSAVLFMIAQLYAVEKTARLGGLSGEDLRLARERGSRPVLDRLHQYLIKIQDEVLPKSDAGQAVAYALKNWKALTCYCDDGDLSIDNNAAERAIRGVAVGRSNWTFFGSDNGGKTAAVLRSFITSCELVKVYPFVWLRDVLSRIADHPVNKLDELLPHNWSLANN